jgi:hypothetical protein
MKQGNVGNERTGNIPPPAGVDKELFDAWRRGDREAFDRAWAILHQRTYRVGVRFLGPFTDHTRRAMASCNGGGN